MSRKIFLDAFYNQFSDFLTQLVDMYPDDNEFGLFLDNLSFAKKTNPMLLVNFIKTDVIDLYLEKIQSKDETFFINTSYETHANADLDIIDKLRKYFSTMSTTSKDVVWKYVDIITRLCLKVLES